MRLVLFGIMLIDSKSPIICVPAIIAFSTIIGWGLYGSRCIEFLGGVKVIRPFMVVYSLIAIIGATVDLDLIWGIADTFNGLMAIPNLIAVFLLSGTVFGLVKEYFKK